VGNKTK
jgi:hypothetical protein